MGLKDIWRRWSKSEDERVVERAAEAVQLTPIERDFANEDFEGRKDDVGAFNNRAGSAAAGAARDDLDAP